MVVVRKAAFKATNFEARELYRVTYIYAWLVSNWATRHTVAGIVHLTRAFSLLTTIVSHSWSHFRRSMLICNSTINPWSCESC